MGVFLDFDFNLLLLTTHGFSISTIQKSASLPFCRVPLSIPRIFAGFEVNVSINLLSSIDLLWKSSKPSESKVSIPLAPVAACEKVSLFDSSSSGLWSETITSIVPSFIPWTRDCLSFSVLKGGDNFKKVLKSPISFSFNERLLIETPVEKILPSFLAFLIKATVFSDDICEIWYLQKYS